VGSFETDPSLLELAAKLLHHHPLPRRSRLGMSQQSGDVRYPESVVPETTVSQIALGVFNHPLRHVAGEGRQ